MMTSRRQRTKAKGPLYAALYFPEEDTTSTYPTSKLPDVDLNQDDLISVQWEGVECPAKIIKLSDDRSSVVEAEITYIQQNVSPPREESMALVFSEDLSTGVCPVSWLKEGDQTEGSHITVNWNGSTYESTILKISADQDDLNKAISTYRDNQKKNRTVKDQTTKATTTSKTATTTKPASSKTSTTSKAASKHNLVASFSPPRISTVIIEPQHQRPAYNISDDIQMQIAEFTSDRRSVQCQTEPAITDLTSRSIACQTETAKTASFACQTESVNFTCQSEVTNSTYQTEVTNSTCQTEPARKHLSRSSTIVHDNLHPISIATSIETTELQQLDITSLENMVDQHIQDTVNQQIRDHSMLCDIQTTVNSIHEMLHSWQAVTVVQQTPETHQSTTQQASTPCIQPSSTQRTSTPCIQPSTQQTSTPCIQPSSTQQTSTPDIQPSSTQQTSTPDIQPSSTQQTSTPCIQPSSAQQTSTPCIQPSSTQQTSTPDIQPSSTQQTSTPQLHPFTIPESTKQTTLLQPLNDIYHIIHMPDMPEFNFHDDLDLAETTPRECLAEIQTTNNNKTRITDQKFRQLSIYSITNASPAVLLENLSALKPVDVFDHLPDDILRETRVKSHDSTRKFAVSIFRTFCTFDDVHQRNVRGKIYQSCNGVVKGQINPTKIQMIKEAVMKYYPVPPTQQTKEWSAVVRAIDKANWQFHQHLTKTYDLTDL